MLRLRSVVVLLITLYGILLPSTQAQDSLQIATTIRPLQFIAVAIAGEQTRVSAIIDAQSSPHHFNLTPSDRLEIADADLVLWIGPELEQALTRFLGREEMSGRVIRVSGLPGLSSWTLDNGEFDAHLWLDPQNAVVIAAAIRDRLIAMDADNAAGYRANFDRFNAALEQTMAETRARLAQSRGRPYLVYHNAFQYFEKRFALEHALALLDNPEVQPGMRDLLELRSAVADSAATCLLAEPEANDNLIATVSRDGPPLRRVSVDLLGYELVVDETAYTRLISGLGDRFFECLNGGMSRSGN